MPASYENIANLNLKEQQFALVNTQIDIARIQLREFVEIEWTPEFLKEISMEQVFVDDVRKAQDKNDRLTLYVEWFVEIFEEIVTVN